MRPLLAFLAISAVGWAGGGPKSTVNDTKVPVWVEPGGAAPQFKVKLNGEDAGVLRVLGPEDPLVLMVVLDLVGDLTLVDAARAAVNHEIESLKPNELASVLRAQDGLKVLVDPTVDREAVTSAISGVPVGGKAGLLDTVEQAERVADAIGHRAAVRVAVLYVTDSTVYNYREDFTNPVINSSDSRDLSRRFPEGLVRERISKLEPPMLAYEAPLFLVHVAYTSDRLGEAYQNGLAQLALATGGSSLFCRSVAEIPESVSKMFEAIRSHYSVTVKLPPGLKHSVQIQVEGEPKVTSARARMAVSK